MTQQYVRFCSGSHEPPRYGIKRDESIAVLDSPPWYDIRKTGENIKITDSIRFFAPIEPTKIVCIGLNYHAHVKASQSANKAPERPLIFLKPPSAIIGPEDDIVHPIQSERVDYEAELGIIIGKTTRNVTEEEAITAIFGLTCVNDVTARDLQKVDGQWSRAKGFDTFCPVGPAVVTGIDYSDLLVEGILNGKVMQSGRTSQMIFNVPYLISYVSSIMTLYPGDLISTGTPEGIAPMKPGDRIEVKVEHIGSLINRVVDAV